MKLDLISSITKNQFSLTLYKGKIKKYIRKRKNFNWSEH